MAGVNDPSAIVAVVGGVVSPTALAGGSLTLAQAATAQLMVQSRGITRGFILKNPASATSQGIVAAESIWFDMTGAAAVAAAGGTSFELQPGESFQCDYGLTSGVSWIAATVGHKISGNAL